MTALQHLRPKTLRDLAAAIEARSPEATARRVLSDEGIDRLADLLIDGQTPTIGLFRKYRKEEAR